jgi:hypothetical protein
VDQASVVLLVETAGKSGPDTAISVACLRLVQCLLRFHGVAAAPSK